MANPPTSDSGSSHSKSLKGKRKKAVPANANPLFTKWLTEWKDEASAKGWKSHYNYAKALKTLKMFPLCLESGKDCKMLQNFGDKICRMLDEKLAEHKQNQSEENNNEDTTDSIDAPSTSGVNQCVTDVRSTSTTIHAISDNSDSGREEVSTPKKRKKRKSGGSGPREYVPAYRSGPYAIILTMYRHFQDPDFKGFFTKAELIHAAQPLADKSFTFPDVGSHYTAWSSMGNLIKRGLITKNSSPAKYYLTQEGSDLGERLENAEMGESDSQTGPAPRDGCNAGQPLSPSSPLKVRTNIEVMDFSFSDKNKASSSRQKATKSSTSCYDPGIVYIVSDDELEMFPSLEVKGPGLSKFARTHSLSSSPSSVPSSPSSHITKEFGTSKFKSSDAANRNRQFENMDVISDCEIDDVNILGVGDQTPPKRLRLPSLSPSLSLQDTHNNWDSPLKTDHAPPLVSCFKASEDDCADDEINITGVSFTTPIKCSGPSSSKSLSSKDDNHHRFNSPTKVDQAFPPSKSNEMVVNDLLDEFDDNVIEIDDDDHNCVNSGTNIKKNMFSSDAGAYQSQSSQSDEDELPDLDFNIPLSKRLLSQGVIKSQLLMSHANDYKIATGSVDKSYKSSVGKSGVSSKTIDVGSVDKSLRNSDESSGVSAKPCHSHSTQVLLSEWKTSGMSKQFTSITNKVKSSVSQDSCRVKSTLPMVAETVGTGGIMELSSDTPPIPQFTLLPGSFEIVLCVDNREFYGSKSNSKTLLPDLIKSGVTCDLRLLHIGDILWIARELGSTSDTASRDNRKELVLNFAIERKRMDDLVSSITGGRLKEQKFRLRHCGLSELIILIEEYGSIQNFSISEDRIKQSFVNSQVLDGFKVKRCGSSKEAVTYLAFMTKLIQKYFSNKTLHAASHEYVKATAPKATIRDREYYLMPFNTFNETSIKHKALSVKEMFGKHLIQIPGVSLDRASAMIKVYPTMTLLMTAYEDCTSEKSKESLLATIKCGAKDRNLGIAVSRMVYMVYGKTSTLS